MEEAGRAVADAVQVHYPVGRVLILAGSGANGGDGFVAARQLLALSSEGQGRDVLVLAQPSKHALTRLNRRRWTAVSGVTQSLTPAHLKRHLPGAAVVVDGLLGTGFVPPVRPNLAEIFDLVNAADVSVLAIDLPSGLEAASADAPVPSVRADHTVTFMGWKTALLFGNAAAQAGAVMLAPLRVPAAWVVGEALGTRPTDAEVAALLPVRRRDAHKGTAGRVWVLGGQAGMVGAPALTGLGALRAGAGLVDIFSMAEIPLITPELMIHHHSDWPAALRELSLKPKPNAVAVGMGLGSDAVQVAREVLSWRVPTVLDADALQPEMTGLGHQDCLWTPHPGEAARLLGAKTPDITRDPLEAAQKLQTLLGGVVILKGGPSVIAYPDGVYVSLGGHPGMASGGMGDTLSGMLAGLLGQGLSAHHAALAGVRLHALAGELAAQRYGYGLGASDVIGEIGTAWAALADAALPAGRKW